MTIKKTNDSWYAIFGNTRFEKGKHKWDFVMDEVTRSDGFLFGICTDEVKKHL